MKNITKSIIALAVAVSPVLSAHALTLEIAPLALKARAEVVGVQVAVDGQKAIIFTGKAARTLARGAGVAFDSGTQMIVATGSEAERLVASAASRGLRAGETAFVMTRDLTAGALELSQDAIASGLEIAKKPVNFLAQATLNVLDGLAHAVKNPVTVLTDAGRRVYNTGAAIVGTVSGAVCDLFGIIGINLGC